MKRFVAACLALFLAAVLLAVPAFAEGEVQTAEDFLQAVEAGQETIKLSGDITLTQSFTLKKNVTIDLNGNKLTMTYCNVGQTATPVSALLTDTVGNGTLESNTPYQTFSIAKGSSLQISGVSQLNTSSSIGNNGSLTITNSKLVCDSATGMPVIMNNGTLQLESGAVLESSAYVTVQNSGTIVVGTGAQVKNTNAQGAALANKTMKQADGTVTAAKATISGGTVEAAGWAVVQDTDLNNVTDPQGVAPLLILESGAIISTGKDTSGVYATDGLVQVKGGSITAEGTGVALASTAKTAAALDLTAGSITGKDSGVYVDANAKATIAGGSVKGPAGNAITGAAQTNVTVVGGNLVEGADGTVTVQKPQNPSVNTKPETQPATSATAASGKTNPKTGVRA